MLVLLFFNISFTKVTLSLLIIYISSVNVDVKNKVKKNYNKKLIKRNSSIKNKLQYIT